MSRSLSACALPVSKSCSVCGKLCSMCFSRIHDNPRLPMQWLHASEDFLSRAASNELCAQLVRKTEPVKPVTVMVSSSSSSSAVPAVTFTISTTSTSTSTSSATHAQSAPAILLVPLPVALPSTIPSVLLLPPENVQLVQSSSTSSSNTTHQHSRTTGAAFIPLASGRSISSSSSSTSSTCPFPVEPLEPPRYDEHSLSRRCLSYFCFYYHYCTVLYMYCTVPCTVLLQEHCTVQCSTTSAAILIKASVYI
jgi:hypothetical protein